MIRCIVITYFNIKDYWIKVHLNYAQTYPVQVWFGGQDPFAIWRSIRTEMNFIFPIWQLYDPRLVNRNPFVYSQRLNLWRHNGCWLGYFLLKIDKSYSVRHIDPLKLFHIWYEKSCKPFTSHLVWHCVSSFIWWLFDCGGGWFPALRFVKFGNAWQPIANCKGMRQRSETHFMDFIVAKNISFGVKTEIETNRLHGFELITSILK